MEMLNSNPALMETNLQGAVAVAIVTAAKLETQTWLLLDSFGAPAASRCQGQGGGGRGSPRLRGGRHRGAAGLTASPGRGGNKGERGQSHVAPGWGWQRGAGAEQSPAKGGNPPAAAQGLCPRCQTGGVGGAGDAVVGCRVVPTAWGWCVVFAARSSSPSAPQILPCTPVSGGLLAGCSVCAHGAAGRAGCLPGVCGDLRWPGVTRGHPCSTQEDIWDLTVTRCVGATPHLGMALRGGLRGFHLGGAAWPPPFPPRRRAAGEGRGVLPACPHLRQHQPGSARFWGTALHPLPAAQAGTEPPVTSRLG